MTIGLPSVKICIRCACVRAYSLGRFEPSSFTFYVSYDCRCTYIWTFICDSGLTTFTIVSVYIFRKTDLTKITLLCYVSLPLIFALIVNNTSSLSIIHNSFVSIIKLIFNTAFSRIVFGTGHHGMHHANLLYIKS